MSNSNQTNTVSEQIETVRMNNDGDVSTAEIADRVEMPKQLKDATANEMRIHDIKDFLMRPVIVSSTAWTTSMATGALVGGSSLYNPTTLIDRVMHKQKMSGFLGFRADMVLTLQVNGTRFQQGLLLMNYLPLSDAISARRAALTTNMLAATQLPHIVYDVSTDTEVSLCAPFVYNKVYYSPYAKTLERLIGTFNIIVYSPLFAGSGDTSANVTIWAHFENIDLEYPTYIAQGIEPRTPFRAPGTTVPGEEQERETFEAQGPRRSKGGQETAVKSVSEQELQRAGVGPISGFFAKVAGATNVLAQVPMLSQFAAPASWFSNILSGAASAAGWSKPTQNGAFTRVQPNRFAMMANTNGVDNSVKLAADADNAIEILPGFGGTDCDELHIQRIVSRWSYFKRFNLATGGAGGIIDRIAITPLTFSQTFSRPVTNSADANIRLNTPLSYVATHFKLWRGSIKLRIRLVKTEFHSGRIALIWVPHNQSTPYTGAGDNFDGCYKEVYDIREHNVIEFCVPYVSTTMWTRLPYGSGDVDNGTGTIIVSLLNPIRAPATVTSSISLVWEVAGGEDMQFAVPTADAESPIDAVLVAQGLPVYMAQGLDQNAKTQSVSDMAIGVDELVACTMREDRQMSAARFCVGEAILSLRALGKRSSLWFSDIFAAGAKKYFNPFAVSIMRYDNSAITSSGMVDYYSRFAVCFGLLRGGVKLKFFQKNGQDDFVIRGITYPYSTTIYGTGFNSYTGATEGAYPFKGSMTGGVEVEVPQYCVTHSRINVYSSGTFAQNATDSGGGDVYPGMGLQINSLATGNANVTYYRQFSDDTDFGVFIGVVPTLTNGSAYFADQY